MDIECGEPIDYGVGTALSDFDHARLVEAYVGHSCRARDTARALKGSSHIVTRRVEDHRLEVLRDGYYARGASELTDANHPMG
jgi:hypothetical protein